MTFRLGVKSNKELVGVHPIGIELVKRSIQLSPVDFAVHDGLRTLREQKNYFDRGVSKTMNSKHLTQEDGFGHAFDLVPYVNRKLRWEWNPIFKIAWAVAQAAKEHRIEIRWGGVWDKPMSDYSRSSESMEEAVSNYCLRHPGPDFIDGPHFELILD